MTVFVTAMLLLNITPGPDMLYVIARSVGQGRAAGIASALGVGAGCFFHIFAVALGVAELLRTVPVAYQAIRYAGASRHRILYHICHGTKPKRIVICWWRAARRQDLVDCAGPVDYGNRSLGQLRTKSEIRREVSDLSFG